MRKQNIFYLCPQCGSITQNLSCGLSPLELHNAKTAGVEVSRHLPLVLRFYVEIFEMVIL